MVQLKTCIGTYEQNVDACQKCGVAGICKLLQNGKLTIRDAFNLMASLRPRTHTDAQILKSMMEDLKGLENAGFVYFTDFITQTPTTQPQKSEEKGENLEEEPQSPTQPQPPSSSEEVVVKEPEEELEHTIQLGDVSVVVDEKSLEPSPSELGIVKTLFEGTGVTVLFSKKKVGRGGWFTYVRPIQPVGWPTGVYVLKSGEVKIPIDPDKKTKYRKVSKEEARQWVLEMHQKYEAQTQ